MITLKQLAELSGLSVRTVGRVLNGSPYVSADKRAAVLELARQYRYIPNMAARNLRLQRKKFVGILFNNYTTSSDSRLINMLNSRLVANGFWPMLGSLEQQSPHADMLREWAGVAEYVVIFHYNNMELLEQLFAQTVQLPLKFIFADCARSLGKYAFAVDREGSILAMVRELSAMGFRRLLYCGSLTSRNIGIQQAGRAGLPLRIDMLETPFEFEDGLRIGPRVMASGADVVFFDTDRMAAGFYRYAAQNKVAIPADIAVVGFDDEPFSNLLTPPLASLAHPRQQIIDRILEILRTGAPPPPEPIAMDFIRRDSLRVPARD